MELKTFKGSLKDLLHQQLNPEQVQQTAYNRKKKKTINVLCYIPYYGGNFLSTVLSLNSNIVPIKPVTDNANRASDYKFNPLPAPRVWASYSGNNYPPTELMKQLEENYDYDTATIAMNPVEFYEYPIGAQDLRTTVNYITVTLDPKDKYVIDRFIRFNRLETREQDGPLNEQFVIEYNPIEISLSQIMIGETEFLTEYKKICAAIGQEPHDSALELYRAWYKERKFDLFKL